MITGCTLAEADEVAPGAGHRPTGQARSRRWFRPLAEPPRLSTRRSSTRSGRCSRRSPRSGSARRTPRRSRCRPTSRPGSRPTTRPRSSPGCSPTTPGMYPKRLILDDARQFGIAVLPLDVNPSDASYRVERVDPPDEPSPAHPRSAGPGTDRPPTSACRTARLRHPAALADVKGISEAEVARIVAGRPYRSLADFWHRARVSRPVVERLVVAGGLRLASTARHRVPVRRRGRRHPPRPAAPGRRAGPVDRAVRRARAAPAPGRAARHRGRQAPPAPVPTAGRTPVSASAAARQSQAAAPGAGGRAQPCSCPRPRRRPGPGRSPAGCPR